MQVTAILSAINDWVETIIRTLGYPGLGLATFLQTVFPPIPSELVLPLAGWMTLREDTGFTFLGAIIVSTIGAVAGALCFYGLGAWVNETRFRVLLRRHGKWFLMSERDLNVSLDWFQRHGESVVFFGRLMPLVRSLISVPAGFAHMHLGRFTLYTALGAGLWSFLLIAAGRMLGRRWDLVAEFLDRYQPVVIALVVLGVLGFIYIRWRKFTSCKRESQGVC